MLITNSQSPVSHLQIAFVVQLTVRNQETLHLLSEMTKKSSKSLYLRSWNQQMKNDKLGLGKKSDYGRCVIASWF